MAEVKKGGIRPKVKGKKRGGKITKFNDLDKSTQKKYCKSVLASLVAGRVCKFDFCKFEK
jgi:hypothetical protein